MRQEGRRRRLGSAARLSLVLAVLLGLILAVTAWETVRVFSSQARTTVDRTLISDVENASRVIEQAPSGDLGPTTVAYLRSQVLLQGHSLIVGLPSGVQLGSAGAGHLLSSGTIRQLLADPPTHSVLTSAVVDGVPLRYLASPIRSGGRVVGTVVALADLASTAADQRRVELLISIEAAVALLAACGGAYLLLRRLLSTVGEMTTLAGSIEKGELDQRLGDPGTDDEVGQLAATFDAMLDRLQAAMVLQRRLLSDVSHQLRTPLTVARGHLEVLARQPEVHREEVLETTHVVVDELDHMRALVERLLLLGRALEPDFLQPEPLDLRTFMTDLFEATRVLAPRRWELAPIPDVVLVVDVAKVRGALLNLIDNAVGATAEDDVIRLESSWDGTTLALGVADSGPGLTEEQQVTVLARFGRLGTADREGSGLGLAIVTAVAEAHDGSFSLGRSEFGGCRATMSFPAAAVVVPEVP